MGDSIGRPAHRQILRNAEEVKTAFACLCINSRGFASEGYFAFCDDGETFLQWICLIM
jgi:hypothetical protein